MKLKKVEEPDHYDEEWCPRCDTVYCSDCVDFHEVEFSIITTVSDSYSSTKKDLTNWKGDRVCPWCYNQLVDLKRKEGREK